METAVFEVFDTTLAATEPELLGLWATKSGSDEATAFAVNSLTTSNAPLWRVNLPVDPSLASTYLENSQVRLNESQTALGIASERINLLVTKINAEGEANRAFDLFSATRELAQPEQELLVTLLEIRKIGLTASLNWHEELVGNLKQAAQKFQGLTERLLSIVANSAWVETQLQGQTIARTAVDWTGDMNSVCRESVNHQQVAFHQHTIALALASQKTLLQTFSLAVQTAMKFSILMTMPGGLILVVPITWKFIHQIIANSSGGLTNEQL